MTTMSASLIQLNTSGGAEVRRVAFPGQLSIPAGDQVGVWETGSITYPWAGTTPGLVAAVELVIAESNPAGWTNVRLGPGVVYSGRGSSRGDLRQQGAWFSRTIG